MRMAPRRSSSASPPAAGSAFFGGLPVRGIWTALGLGRGQFFAILALSVGLFVAVGGPVWMHSHASHLLRIGISYGVIPPAVALALWRNRRLRVGLLLGASAVLALIKLVLTALLLMAIGIAG
jgi:hypothetical protein